MASLYCHINACLILDFTFNSLLIVNSLTDLRQLLGNVSLVVFCDSFFICCIYILFFHCRGFGVMIELYSFGVVSCCMPGLQLSTEIQEIHVELIASLYVVNLFYNEIFYNCISLPVL